MKWGWLLCFGIIIIFISIVFAYTPPSYDNVTLILNDTTYTPPSYDNVILVLEGGAAPPPVDSCDCPNPPANWFMSLADNCNITTNCDIKGYNFKVENGTAGDIVNCSAMVVCDNFDFNDAGADTKFYTMPDCYINTTQ